MRLKIVLTIIFSLVSINLSATNMSVKDWGEHKFMRFDIDRDSQLGKNLETVAKSGFLKIADSNEDQTDYAAFIDEAEKDQRLYIRLKKDKIMFTATFAKKELTSHKKFDEILTLQSFLRNDVNTLLIEGDAARFLAKSVEKAFDKDSDNKCIYSGKNNDDDTDTEICGTNTDNQRLTYINCSTDKLWAGHCLFLDYPNTFEAKAKAQKQFKKLKKKISKLRRKGLQKSPSTEDLFKHR